MKTKNKGKRRRERSARCDLRAGARQVPLGLCITRMFRLGYFGVYSAGTGNRKRDRSQKGNQKYSTEG